MIQSEKQTEVEKEVRQVVDEAMRQELELLNAVINFYSLKIYHTFVDVIFSINMLGVGQR
jgi:predicted GNAT family acetyltransferase